GVVKGATDAIAASDGKLRWPFVISTPGVDRQNDTIALDGWRLDAYRANPTVLLFHNGGNFPVGKTVSLYKSSAALHAVVELAPADIPAEAKQAAEMIRSGFRRGASVGFLPKRWAFAKDQTSRPLGIDILEAELIEWSLTPTPANAACL